MPDFSLRLKKISYLLGLSLIYFFFFSCVDYAYSPDNELNDNIINLNTDTLNPLLNYETSEQVVLNLSWNNPTEYIDLPNVEYIVYFSNSMLDFSNSFSVNSEFDTEFSMFGFELNVILLEKLNAEINVETDFYIKVQAVADNTVLSASNVLHLTATPY